MAEAAPVLWGLRLLDGAEQAVGALAELVEAKFGED